MSLFSWKGAKNCAPFLVLLMLILLNGCGAKQGSGPQASVPAVIPPDDSCGQLSQTEIAALKSTGQIDRDVPQDAMADVALQYKYFLRKGRKTMCVFSRRSERYLAYARQVFRDRGLPEELANLAIVESGYRPDAKSSAGAVGAWQFMPETGMKYGLALDAWQDERLDPYRSTEAAADYLKKLYNDFGDWPTAIAAYNAGEGKISRAKAGTGGKDFFEVKAMNHKLDGKAQLKDETQQYVPRFIAVTKIMRNLPELGFEPIEPEKADGVMRFAAKPGTDLTAFSKACNMSWPEFSYYNQHHKRRITCTDKTTFVYVPAKARKLASDFLCTEGAARYAGWKLHKVGSSSDSLEKISRRSNTPLAMLQAANPGIGRLKTGQLVLAPGGVNMSSKAVAALTPKKGGKGGAVKSLSSQGGQNEMAYASDGYHVLKSNETLYAVARKYNVSPSELQAHNSIDNPSRIRPGHKLRIPGKGGRALKGKSSGKIGKRKSVYTVQARDNLWSIAKRYNISVDDLKRWNNVNEKNLKPGLSLVVAEE